MQNFAEKMQNMEALLRQAEEEEASAAAAADARKVCRPDAPLCSALPVCGTQDGASMSQSCRVMLACLDDGECWVSFRV